MISSQQRNRVRNSHFRKIAKAFQKDRWKTDIARNMYVKESEHDGLSVSRSLGL
jgi:hypothetical protein